MEPWQKARNTRRSSRRRLSGCWRSIERRISSETNAIVVVEKELGVAPETLGRWRNQSDATVVAESKRSAEDAMAEFIGMLDDHTVWYRDKRIKTEFGMSLMDRRRRLGLAA